MDWLKEMRIKRGLNQREAAQFCGISPQAYNFIENEKRKASISVAKKIAKAFAFDWTKFYEDDKEV